MADLKQAAANFKQLNQGLKAAFELADAVEKVGDLEGHAQGIQQRIAGAEAELAEVEAKIQAAVNAAAEARRQAADTEAKAKEKADKIVADAGAKAKAMIDEANAEADKIEETSALSVQLLEKQAEVAKGETAKAHEELTRLRAQQDEAANALDNLRTKLGA
jgi:cell division septum initiation protein DivIVA